MLIITKKHGIKRILCSCHDDDVQRDYEPNYIIPKNIEVN